MTPQTIAYIKQAAEQFGVDPWQVISRSRKRPIVYARFTVMRAMRADGKTMPQIARAFGVDHTSVLHALTARMAVQSPAQYRRSMGRGTGGVIRLR